MVNMVLSFVFDKNPAERGGKCKESLVLKVVLVRVLGQVVFK